MQRRAELRAGACTAGELEESVEAFFDWEHKTDRLAVLMTAKDDQLLRLKWHLLQMLRAIDVYVLERGAIEQYYPEGITGADKPSRAQDFCAKVTSRDAIMNCCGEQELEVDSERTTENEFDLIFTGIFGANGHAGSNAASANAS